MSASGAASGAGASAGRVGAMVLRYWYLLRGSWPRLVELAYWPTVQMTIWGFITGFFLHHSSWVAEASGVLLSAVLLWDVLFRAQLGLTIPFLEEMWSRNLGHLFVSPLRPWEWLASLMVMSLVRTLIGVTPAMLLAIPLYAVSIFDLGPPLVMFYACLLVMGWAVGLAVCGMVLRFGLGAESLAWIAIFAFAPISGVYYPVSALPAWLQPVALATPSAHVFEGMRAVLFEHVVPWRHLAWAVALDLVYVAVGAGLMLWAFGLARRDGQLLQMGE